MHVVWVNSNCAATNKVDQLHNYFKHGCYYCYEADKGFLIVYGPIPTLIKKKVSGFGLQVRVLICVVEKFRNKLVLLNTRIPDYTQFWSLTL